MLRTVFIVAAACAAPAVAQPPAIYQNGVSNSASRLPSTLPGARLAPGARFLIRGVRLGGEVRIAKATARVLRVSPEEIEAVVPAGVSPGETAVVVTRGGESSLPFPVHIARAAPGLYSRNGLGWGPAEVERLAGGVIALRVTGIGRPSSLEFFVAGRRVPVRSTAGGRILLQLPRGMPEGCYVPVYTRTDGITSNVVTIPVGRCDPPRPRAALVLLWRFAMLLEFRPGDPEPGTEEGADAYFLSTPAPSVVPIEMTPPAGTCTAVAGIYRPGGTPLDWSLDATGARGLEAGDAIEIAGPNGKRAVAEAAPGFYRARPPHRMTEPMLPPGEYRVSGSGGKEIGPFAATFRAISPLTWKNREQLSAIDRARGATLEWTGADPARPVLIAAMSADRQTTAAWACLCAAAPGATRFTLPPALLANLPATHPAAGMPVSLLLVMQTPAAGQAEFHAHGLDEGTARFLLGSGRSITYR